MIKYFSLVVILVAVTLTSTAQQLMFNLSIGGGTYAMKDMKMLQSEIKSQFPFEPSITDEFPPYLFYEGSCHVSFSQSFFTGMSLSYGSTGGRVQYHDYSGYMRADQELLYISLGLPVGFRLEAGKNLTVSFDLRPTATRTLTDIKFEQEVMGSSEANELSLKSESLAIQPGVMVVRRISQFALHAQLSYYQTIVKGKMYLKNDDGAYLLNSKNEPVHPGWDGLRLSLGASLFIGG